MNCPSVDEPQCDPVWALVSLSAVDIRRGGVTSARTLADAMAWYDVGSHGAY